MKKKISLVLCTISFSMFMLVTAFAGSWKQDSIGWWYQEDNGSYPQHTWKKVNGSWYYFDSKGYMLSDSYTMDGYYLGKNGVWDVSVPRRVGLEEISNSLYQMNGYSLEFGAHTDSEEGETRFYVNFMGHGMSNVWHGMAIKYETDNIDGLRIYFMGKGENDILSVTWHSRETMDFPTVYYKSKPGSLPIEGGYYYVYDLYGN